MGFIARVEHHTSRGSVSVVRTTFKDAICIVLSKVTQMIFAVLED